MRGVFQAKGGQDQLTARLVRATNQISVFPKIGELMKYFDIYPKWEVRISSVG